jgi:hypothetical protein
LSRRLAAALALATLVSEAGAREPGEERVISTAEHYEVSTSGPQAEADEWARMLEAAWPQYAEFFGTAAKLRRGERLRVAMYEDDATWRAAILAGGGTPPQAGGYYCPGARVAYIKRQPSPWYTRTLLLHEAAHQYHYFARSGHGKPGGNWYVEGVAEHLGSHSWDGETLHLGVLPLLSLENRAGAALTAVSAPEFSLDDLIEAPAASRPEAMLLVRFLQSTRRKKFDALARRLDRGTVVQGKGFTRAVGKSEKLLEEWREWLAAHQEPLVPVFVDWDTRGPALLHGAGTVVSICRSRDAAASVEARVSALDDRALRAGLLISFESPQRYVIAVVDQRGGRPVFHVDPQHDGKWTRLAQENLGEGDAPWTLTAVRAESGVSVTVGDRDVGRFDVPSGSMGFAFENCRAAFTDVEIRAAE